ncbi:CapA family protein [Aquibacillus sp. 3ASR75-11]|uniref:CapA family protein n=1 Tax=Terrihalobacillus insolitus TaxID=2950438 RepID=A0A9X4AMD8_9BACI|nr:CapA family protein [Terrihalobacillus insolitus]MDC3413142.1 CapA family protein [Terrihalobacillus insolitus]MDC3425186.1 CapA family protein [Terrihalobacillus insolitus]
MKQLCLIVVTFLGLLLFFGCSQEKNKVNQIEEKTANEEVEGTPKGETAPEVPKPITKSVRLTAIGDILIHDSVYEDAKSNDGFDFFPMLERVQPYLEDSTITVANQETMIGGKAIGLSGYPRFNSPFQVGDALKEAGVDVVSIANNHTMDRGEQAIQNAIQYWESIDMMYTGAYKDKVDSSRIRVFETAEGIDVAFLSFTYGTNGIVVPDGKSYLVNLIDQGKIVQDIKEAKQLSDVIVLSLHFGQEYERLPNQEQKDLVQLAADNGVQVVIGHHPHVLQPVEWVEGKNGNRTFVAYSLGNFLSGQDEFFNRIGGAITITIEKTIVGDEQSIQIKDPRFLPTFVQYNNESDFEVTPMFELTNEELPNASKHYEDIRKHMSQWLPELSFIESD